MPKPKVSSSRARFNARQAEAVANNRLQRLNPGARQQHISQAIRTELTYLVDPLRLAQNIVEKLRDNQLEQAMELVRASDKARDGKGVDNIVSWNHYAERLST